MNRFAFEGRRGEACRDFAGRVVSRVELVGLGGGFLIVLGQFRHLVSLVQLRQGLLRLDVDIFEARAGVRFGALQVFKKLTI